MRRGSRREFQFDYGEIPRGPMEESLGGDFSKAVAIASDLRVRLQQDLGWRISEPAVANFGAAMWIENAPPQTILRSALRGGRTDERRP